MLVDSSLITLQSGKALFTAYLDITFFEDMGFDCPAFASDNQGPGKVCMFE